MSLGFRVEGLGLYIYMYTHTYVYKGYKGYTSVLYRENGNTETAV